MNEKQVKKNQSEFFGWSSEQDAIHEVSNNIPLDIFEYSMFSSSSVENCQFIAAKATSDDKPFYDELLKMSDYVVGILADYYSNTRNISKPKFDTVLTEYRT